MIISTLLRPVGVTRTTSKSSQLLQCTLPTVASYSLSSREINNTSQQFTTANTTANRRQQQWNHTNFNNWSNNSQQVMALYHKGNVKEAIEEYFKAPHPVSASFLISKQQKSLDTSFQIYRSLKQRGQLNLFVINSLLLSCRKQQQMHRAREVMEDAMKQLHKMLSSPASGTTSAKSSDFKSLDMLLSEFSHATGRHKESKLIYEYMKRSGLVPDRRTMVVLMNSLVTHSLTDVLHIYHDICSTFQMRLELAHYTCLMKAYIHANRLRDAIDILTNDMENAGMHPDNMMYTVLLTGCADRRDLQSGKIVHQHLLQHMGQRSSHIDIQLRNTLVSMYGKCGVIQEAESEFHSIDIADRNNMTWYSMIAAYALSRGHIGKAVKLLDEMMERSNVVSKTDPVPFVTLLSACAEHGEFELVNQIHDRYLIGNDQLLQSIPLKNTLINLYGKMGELDRALSIFNSIDARNKSIVTWNAMIGAYCLSSDHLSPAFELLEEMEQCGMRANHITYTSLLTGCANHGNVQLGRRLHERFKRSDLELDSQLQNTLINMYGKCGALVDALHLFDTMDMAARTRVTWISMIHACVKMKHMDKAIQLLVEMEEHTKSMAEKPVYLMCLTGCADNVSTSVGKQLHDRIKQRHDTLRHDVDIVNSIIHMYGLCGLLDDALSVFNEASVNNRTVVTWNAMINVYAQHGRGREALALFEEMISHQVAPDEVTFISLLNACSHSGLVSEALDHFYSMATKWQLSPNVKHVTCIVDALGRAGQLEEAEQFLNKIMEPNTITLTTLLGACRSQRDVVRGERIFAKIMALDPEEASAYVLMANIYALAGNAEKSNGTRTLMSEKGIKKIPGVTKIEINGQMHVFFCEDRSHPQIREIRQYLSEMIQRLITAGYKPDPRWVTRDVENLQERESLVCLHSEKIALAYGLMMTPPSQVITITKNLRACGDCHHATKFISKVYNREIIVRDAHRFHHFTPDGKCSCGDYW